MHVAGTSKTTPTVGDDPLKAARAKFRATAEVIGLPGTKVVKSDQLSTSGSAGVISTARKRGVQVEPTASRLTVMSCRSDGLAVEASTSRRMTRSRTPSVPGATAAKSESMYGWVSVTEETATGALPESAVTSAAHERAPSHATRS